MYSNPQIPTNAHKYNPFRDWLRSSQELLQAKPNLTFIPLTTDAIIGRKMLPSLLYDQSEPLEGEHWLYLKKLQEGNDSGVTIRLAWCICT